MSVFLSFFVFLFLGTVVKLIYSKIDTSYEKEMSKPSARCDLIDDLHDWSYHPVTKKLTCTKCNHEAGSYD
jgi:hypothetical protein